MVSKTIGIVHVEVSGNIIANVEVVFEGIKDSTYVLANLTTGMGGSVYSDIMDEFPTAVFNVGYLVYKDL